MLTHMQQQRSEMSSVKERPSLEKCSAPFPSAQSGLFIMAWRRDGLLCFQLVSFEQIEHLFLPGFVEVSVCQRILSQLE